ncbi:hypothetical protein SLI_5220 [Streptomyces lividans 1326]|uniref:Uncharacterized protein n=1 Tax=Streptomyces lividans 1326 TaxID=1200984 RepID=A0A7U9DZF0_STRLI|nr:hypothetical protein SLI_5220 [Streptomyces lividans 1326]
MSVASGERGRCRSTAAPPGCPPCVSWRYDPGRGGGVTGSGEESEKTSPGSPGRDQIVAVSITKR